MRVRLEIGMIKLMLLHYIKCWQAVVLSSSSNDLNGYSGGRWGIATSFTSIYQAREIVKNNML